MQVGHTLGPSFDLEPVPATADFVEPSVGEGERRVDVVDPHDFRERLDARDLGLTVHLPCQQPLATAVPEFDEAHLAYLDRVLGVAAKMGAAKAVAHATARDPAADRQRAALREQIRELDALGDDHGVEVVVENLGYVDHGLELDALGAALAETGAAMCFDVGHAVLEVGLDGTGAFLESQADLVSHLHVHDVDELDRPHVPVGGGGVDWERVADALGGFDGTAAVEVFDEFGYARESERRVRATLA